MALFSIGDAILKFVADTTELDNSFDRIQSESAAKLAPVQAEANAVGAAFDQMAQSAQQAAAASGQVGVEAEKATTQASASYVKLAQATAANQQAQQTLRIAMQNVKQTGGESAQAIELLAQAQEKAAITAKTLADAQAAVKAETEGVALAEKEAGTAAVTMGEEMSLAGQQATFSMQEAKGTIALVGEEAGITVPRHLRTFIAQLPGVGQALEAAFSAVAIFVLVQLIVEATEKLTEFISETFIYTERDKEMYAATVELNKALAEQSQKLTELQKAYSLIGLEGAAKTKAEFMQLTAEVNKNEAALRAAKNTLATYRDEQRSGSDFNTVHTVTEEQANAAGAAILALTALLKTQYQQQANMGKEYDEQELQETIQHGQAIISAHKTIGEANIALLQAGSRLRLLAIKAGYSDEIAEQQRFAQMKYQLDLATLQQERANLEKDPTKNADQIRAKNAEIEALEKQHEANLIDIHVKGMAALQSAIKQAATVTESSTILDKILPPPDSLQARIQAISDLLSQFGIQSDQILFQQADAAQQAFEKVADAYSRGEASIGEYMLTLESAAQAQKKYAAATGDTEGLKQWSDALDGVREALIKLGITEDKDADKQDKWNKHHQNTINLIDKWGESLRKNQAEMTKTQKVFDAVLADATQAFGNAIAQWVLSQDSLGHALRRGLAEEAAVIAGKAAMWGLYFTAWGIADTFWNPSRAGADFASAAEFFAVAALAGAAAYALNPDRGGRGGSQQQAPQTQAAPGIQQGPVQQQNVPRFATGALFTGPTLAIMGDAASSANNSIASMSGAREAAIPLDHPDALRQIGSAIAPHIPAPTVVVNVKGKSLHQLIKDINHEVVHGDAKLTSSNSYKVTSKIGRAV